MFESCKPPCRVAENSLIKPGIVAVVYAENKFLWGADSNFKFNRFLIQSDPSRLSIKKD